jgi:transcriptional regulator with XRE-family HTH domain
MRPSLSNVAQTVPGGEVWNRGGMKEPEVTVQELSDIDGQEEFGSLLRVLREDACLTQEELAERSGVSIRAISDLERGRTMRPHRTSVSRLAKALQIGDDALEKFRRTARRNIANPVPRPSPSLVVDAGAERWPVNDARTAGVDQLREWIWNALVDEQGPRVVQLVGDPGGRRGPAVVRASAQFRGQFPDGQFYMDLECGPEGLAARLARVFGLSQRPSTLEQRLDRLRTALRRRRALLVLDNVVDAAEVRAVLPDDTSCVVIVISPCGLDLFSGVWTVDVRASDSYEESALPSLANAG